MKSFNRTSLPDAVQYNGKEYKYFSASLPSFTQFTEMIKSHKFIEVKVLASALKNCTDLHGKKYKPNSFYFIAPK